MEMIVEGTDKEGAETYAQIFERILLEMGITTVLERVHLLIRPEDPLFVISVRMRKAAGARSVHEVANLEDMEGGVMVSITDENYAPRLLALLWKTYGRDRVEQLTRYEVFVSGVTRMDFWEMKIDPEEELRAQVLDAIWKLVPEGLKIRHTFSSSDVLTIANTEHGFEADWLKKAEEVHHKMEAA
ncbi:MAG: methanogenesis marker 17 protein [Methanomassiliicoccales archaeon]|nr:MAG: methanogenesis marker 17 protein [Methanomassiliicoccales archaeon]